MLWLWGVRVTDKILEMLIKWAFPGLLYACWLKMAPFIKRVAIV